MEYGKIDGIDKPASRVGQGTIMLRPDEPDAAFALLDTVFEGGVNLFDTAHLYSGGECERAFGAWLAGRGVRDELVIIAKGGHPRGGESGVRAETIREELAVSLDRMGIDHADLYLLHRDDPSLSVGEVVAFMSEHVRAGRVCAWGGSNWTYERIRAANEYAAGHGLVPMAASSPQFSLAIPFRPVWADCLTIAGPDAADARDWYRRTGLPLVTWSSMARGFLSGRVSRDDDSVLEASARGAFSHPENFDRLERAVRLAREKNVSVPQLAIAYVLCYPLNIFALVGPCTPAEARENRAAVDLELSPDEITWLEQGGDRRGVSS
ncbi:MAG: aldo/keto reductase [Planctomycetota bacterium]